VNFKYVEGKYIDAVVDNREKNYCKKSVEKKKLKFRVLVQ